MTGSISRPTGGGGGSDPTKLAIAANLSDLASAPTARTNLGLGGAATLNVGTTAGTVAAGDDARIVGATRFDVAQTLTQAQVAQLRANAGFDLVFTTAQLNALDATTSARLRTAYCSDCYISTQTSVGAPTGGAVRWSPGMARWVTEADSLPVSNDFALFAANMIVFGRQQHMIAPVCQTVGLGNSVVTALTNVSGGTLGITTSQAGTSFGQASGVALRMQTGATAGQYASGIFHAGTTFGTTGRRRFAMVMGFIQCQAITTDDYTWQLGVRTRGALGSATPANMWSIGFDPANKTGCNPGTSNLAILTRTNSSAVSSSPSRICNGSQYTITNTTPAWLVVVMEPTNTTSARMRAIVLPQGNTPSTSAVAVVDETWTPSATDFEVGLFGQKTTGSTSNFEVYLRSIGMVSWADNALPTTVEHDPILAINAIS